jgi:hypothetical protein
MRRGYYWAGARSSLLEVVQEVGIPATQWVAKGPSATLMLR